MPFFHGELARLPLDFCQAFAMGSLPWCFSAAILKIGAIFKLFSMQRGIQ